MPRQNVKISYTVEYQDEADEIIRDKISGLLHSIAERVMTGECSDGDKGAIVLPAPPGAKFGPATISWMADISYVD